MPNVFVSVHRKVIAYIHLAFRHTPGQRFAIHQVRKGANVSESGATRTMRKLVDLKLLVHHDKNYVGQFKYSVNQSRWSHNVMEVIENFELAKALDI